MPQHCSGHRLKDSKIVTLAAETVNPHINIRVIENRYSVPQFASRILKWRRFHSYYISLHQALIDADYAARLRLSMVAAENDA